MVRPRNDEAIYGTRPWKRYGESGDAGQGADGSSKRKASKQIAFASDAIRFTQKGNAVYAIALGWPETGVIKIDSLGLGQEKAEIVSVCLLGHPEPLVFTRQQDHLSVKLPETKPCDHAYSLRIELKGTK